MLGTSDMEEHWDLIWPAWVLLWRRVKRNKQQHQQEPYRWELLWQPPSRYTECARESSTNLFMSGEMMKRSNRKRRNGKSEVIRTRKKGIQAQLKFIIIITNCYLMMSDNLTVLHPVQMQLRIRWFLPENISVISEVEAAITVPGLYAKCYNRQWLFMLLRVYSVFPRLH